ncbi:MAG: pentapeptide repeat-containing protein [Planctomycetes bacterium]|nr:pentapeptide repeat-containing protein [Planctomycetota bacterium]
MPRTIAIIVAATGAAITTTGTHADFLPPVDPLCGGCDHSHQDHSGHDHDYETIISINLFGANLSHAVFTGSNLTNAFIKGADLTYANFSEAQLMNAQVAGSLLMGVNLQSAQLSSAEFVFSDLTGANLRYANIAGANFMGATLVDADLRNTAFTGANLLGADLSGADLTLAKFIENAVFDGTTLYDVETNFTGTGFDPIAAGWTLSRAACCVNGNCAVTEEAVCTALGGTYVGTATSCAVAGCVPDLNQEGGCCLDGACIVADADDCTAAGGTFEGVEADCLVNVCGSPCPSDLDGNGIVSFSDILRIIADWGPCP